MVTDVTPVPAVEPKWTAVAPVKLVPVTVTEVPPAAGPVGRVDRGDRRRTVVGVTGHWRLVAEVPLGVVTVTSTAPVPAGR